MTGTERHAAKQSVFREVNERVVEVHRAMDATEAPGAMLEVFCECGRAHCTKRVELTRTEYERVRVDGTHFVLAHGHETALVEHVIARTERYVVVENEGRAAELARSSDPRAET
jgi:hypothetical protein